MNQLVIVWLFPVLCNQNVFHYHFIFPVWEGSIQTLFSTSAILPALKEMEAATAWKDISKETGLIMTVTTKSFFLSHTLPKALFLQWQEVRAISSHISEDWKAACPHGNCSLLRALPSTRRSMPNLLSAYGIPSPRCVSWPFSRSLGLDRKEECQILLTCV